MDTPALHFLHGYKNATKPRSVQYPESLTTWGDHILKRRLDLKLFQKEVAEILGVNVTCIYNWENHRSKPRKQYFRKIEEFLRYKPVF